MVKDIICWWSGGITSAVACKKAIEIYGKNRCKVIMIDTFNEDEDTYRFLKDCEKWYDVEISKVSVKDFDKLSHYNSVEDVWRKHMSLNTATGAICSTVLKRRVREEWQKENTYSHQVFGFEFESKEFNRAKSMTMNHPNVNPIYPLLMLGLNKKDCLDIVEKEGIKIPNMYLKGFSNNNCYKTGCVQGGIGYWQKMKREEYDKFLNMAKIEHELTLEKGEPVTMLKDQSNGAKEIVKETGLKWKQFVFLIKHPNYPELKCLDDMKGREPESLMECMGFCGINDLNPRKEGEGEINLIE